MVTATLGADVAVTILAFAQLIGNLSHMGAGIKQIQWDAVGWFCLTALIGGTLVANKFIKNIDKDKFQNYVAILLRIVGAYMLIFGV